MNYSRNEVLGSAIVSAGTALWSVGTGAYEYHETRKAVDEYNADMKLANAQNTADARNAARQQTYAERFEQWSSNIDKEQAKRYLVIGAAIGVPILAGLFLSRKG